jgi:hypothetical protein
MTDGKKKEGRKEGEGWKEGEGRKEGRGGGGRRRRKRRRKEKRKEGRKSEKRGKEGERGGKRGKRKGTAPLSSSSLSVISVFDACLVREDGPPLPVIYGRKGAVRTSSVQYERVQ